MYVKVITPASAVVTWTEAKAHLRLDSDTEQTLVESLVAAATGWLSGPDGWLGRAVGSQTLEARFELFEDDELVLPYGPVTAITSIKYLEEDAGVETTLASSAYQLLSDGRVVLNTDEEWPSLYTDDEAVRVRYVAGDVPAAIKAAILLIVAYLFEHREASPEDALSTGAVRWLLAPYRVYA